MSEFDPRGLRLTFVVAVYPPETPPSAVMAEELARRWATDGHDVLVICPFPNRPGGRLYPGMARRLWEMTRLEGGGRRLRVPTWLIGPSRRTANRVLENLSFGLVSAGALLVTRRPDVVLLETWPVLAALPVMGVCWLRRIPFVNYIKDIYPESAIAAGLFREGSLVSRVLLRLDALVCGSAARNVVISPRMAAQLASSRRLPESRFLTVRDWVDFSTIKPMENNLKWRRKTGIAEDAFLCLFAGTMGHASRVDILVEVAEELKDRPDIHVVCVGEGVLKSDMQEEIARRGLMNIVLMPFQPREIVAEMLSSADLFLLTTSRGMGASSVPSKLITYLAAGRPVLCAVDCNSDMADLVRDDGLGVVVPPESAPEIAAAILKMMALEPSELERIGREARMRGEQEYSLEHAAEGFYSLFEEVRCP